MSELTNHTEVLELADEDLDAVAGGDGTSLEQNLAALFRNIGDQMNCRQG
ncbi:hypothetical protein [Kitasatospora sp. NPDC093102]